MAREIKSYKFLFLRRINEAFSPMTQRGRQNISLRHIRGFCFYCHRYLMRKLFGDFPRHQRRVAFMHWLSWKVSWKKCEGGEREIRRKAAEVNSRWDALSRFKLLNIWRTCFPSFPSRLRKPSSCRQRNRLSNKRNVLMTKALHQLVPLTCSLTFFVFITFLPLF